jgi:hypothetical protein
MVSSKAETRAPDQCSGRLPMRSSAARHLTFVQQDEVTMSRYIPKEGPAEPPKGRTNGEHIPQMKAAPSVNIGPGAVTPELNARAAAGYDGILTLFRRMFR